MDLSFAWTAFQAILQVFAISLCGFVFTKKGYISKTVQKGLSVLNMNYFTPCLLFSSMVETVTPEVIVELWPMVVFYFVFSALAILICILGCRVFRISPYMHRFAIIALLFSNTNSLPISLLKGIMQSHGASILFQGPDDTPLKASGRAVSYAVIFVVFNNIFRWTVGVRLLAPYAEQKEHLTAHSHKLAAHNRLIQCPSNASLPLDSDTSTATSPVISTYGSTESLDSTTAGLPDSQRESLEITISPSTAESRQLLTRPQSNHSIHMADGPGLLESGRQLSRTRSAASSPSVFTSGWFQERRHSLVRGLKSVGRTCAGCLNAPVYAIIAAIIVQFIPWVNDLVMEPSSVFMPIVKAIDISGDASIPVMLLSLGAQLACVDLGPSRLLSRGNSNTTVAPSSSSSSLDSSTQAPMLTLEDADATAGPSSPANGPVLLAVPNAPELIGLGIVQSHQFQSQPSSNSPGLLSDGSKITMLVMLGRFLLIPLIVVPLLLFLRPYIPVANDDPVFMITLFVLCCMPPAVNLITVAQAMGVFEDESAKLLFYVYVSAIPILVVLVTIFLTVLSVT
ncbi:hypothetical protein H4R33_006238 [Dimargaris cristalligena]|nr:hypothetical protein H4R33_006238 [Dimargaris cristalligena]